MKRKGAKKAISIMLSACLCVPLFPSAVGCGTKETNSVGFATVGETEITDSYAANGLAKELDYLLSIDKDRLLSDFYVNAGLEPNGQAYGGGWEHSLIGGHTTGHYLSALAQAYANAGTPEATRKEIKSRIDAIVSELKICQDNATSAGAKEGFLWGARFLARPERQFDNVEKGRANIATEAWVPWYTMHKLIAGLVDIVEYTGSDTAKTVVTKLGDWVYDRVSKWDEATRAQVLAIEYGGMNDCMYNLYKITGDEKHAIAAHKFDEDIANPGRATSLFEDILSDKADYLDGRHANTTIPKIIGALNRYMTLDGKTIDGEKVDADEMLELAEKFWTRVTEHHTYITGGNSEWEHFGRDDVLDAERTRSNCETCNAYNMLKLSRMLFSVTGEKKYLDFYENTYLNDIWASQNPETGMTTYWQPMGTGYFKVYSSPTEHFWCCTGSGMESFTKLNDSVYYKDKDETVVAMYLASTLHTDGVSLTQTANLENSDEATLHIDEGETELKLRVPDWTQKFEVTLNGQPVTEGADDGFVSVDVKKGDDVKIVFQKTFKAYSLPDNPNAYAFKYGPFVLAAELGTNNMRTSTDGVNVLVPATRDLGGFSETVHIQGNSAQAFMTDLSSHFTAKDGKFVLSGGDEELVYSYFFRQHTERYGVYFEFLGEGENADEGTKNYTFEKIDTVQPGYGQYEIDDWHKMTDNGSVGSTADKELATSRYATAGGSFTYRMAVDKAKTNHLVAYFAKSDAGKSIRISSGETVLFERTLEYNGPDGMYEVLIPIPASVVSAAEDVTINGETRSLIPVTVSSAEGNSARIGSYLYTAVVTFRGEFTGERDNSVAYFVNCGDYDTNTLPEGEKFGKYNSVTEQLFGADYATGMHWGLADGADPKSGTAGSASSSGGISSANTWAQEGLAAEAEKSVSNRYTKNQFENDMARRLSYVFELPEEGTYRIELCFLNPWNCSSGIMISANGEALQSNIAVPNGTTGQIVTTEYEVVGGFLRLDFTTADKCINLAYIKIYFA